MKLGYTATMGPFYAQLRKAMARLAKVRAKEAKRAERTAVSEPPPIPLMGATPNYEVTPIRQLIKIVQTRMTVEGYRQFTVTEKQVLVLKISEEAWE